MNGNRQGGGELLREPLLAAREARDKNGGRRTVLSDDAGKFCLDCGRHARGDPLTDVAEVVFRIKEQLYR